MGGGRGQTTTGPSGHSQRGDLRLTGIVVALIPRTVRSIPTEIPLGNGEGLVVECAVSFDNLQRIRRSALVV